MKNKTLGIIGLILFVIAIILIFINDFVDNNLLKSLADYGIYIALLGGGFIGIGFFGKKKKHQN